MSAISQTTICSYFHHSKRHVRKSRLRFNCFIPNAFPPLRFYFESTWCQSVSWSPSWTPCPAEPLPYGYVMSCESHCLELVGTQLWLYLSVFISGWIPVSDNIVLYTEGPLSLALLLALVSSLRSQRHLHPQHGTLPIIPYYSLPR